jgi:hypothetical protein
MKSKTFDVEIELLEDQLGTVPKNKEVYTSYIANKVAIAGGVEAELESVQEMEEKGWTGFHVKNGKPFILNYMFKGFLKHAGNVLKGTGDITNLRDKIVKYVFIQPRELYFKNAGPGGTLERPLRAETPKGPRVTLAKSDTVPAGSTLSFQIEVLDNGPVSEAVLREILEYGKYCGLGQWRTAGYGAFKINKFKLHKEGTEVKKVQAKGKS